jgi:hypothetical protein
VQKPFAICVIAAFVWAGGPVWAQQSLMPPFRFEANQGQANQEVRFLAVGSMYTAELTENAIVMPTASEPLRLTFTGGRAKTIHPLDSLNLLSGYYGFGSARAYTGIPNYQRVLYESVYPGIDILFYANGNKLEFDFIVAPGASVDAIQLEVSGHDALRLSDSGNLLMKAAGDEVMLSAPRIFQETVAGRQPVSGRFVVTDSDEIGLEVEDYDRSKPLVIDPTLAFSTYVPNRSDSRELPFAIGSDSGGNVYVLYELSGSVSGFNQVMKFSRDGTPNYVVRFQAYGPSSYLLKASDMEVDAAGNAYIVGTKYTHSDFPTKNAIQSELKGPSDAIIFKLDSRGEMVFSTLLGGSDADFGWSLTLDSTGNIYVAGGTSSTDFPIRNSSSASGNMFVAKLDPQGTALLYSTYIDKPGRQYRGRTWLEVDGASNMYIAGSVEDTGNTCTAPSGSYTCSAVSVMKLNPAGTATIYDWRYSAPQQDNPLKGFSVDASGNAYFIRGSSTVVNFDPAATFGKLDPSGTLIGNFQSLLPATYADLAIDVDGNVYLTGRTPHEDSPEAQTFPVINSFRSSVRRDVFVMKLSTDGTRYLYSTFLNGDPLEPASEGYASSWGDLLHVDAGGRVYVTATTGAWTFPTTDGTRTGDRFFSSEAVVFVLDPNATDTNARYSRLEENYFAIQYTGTWYPHNSAAHGAGRAVLAVETGAKASFSFTGNGQVRWFGCKDGWSGIAKVFVDGALQATVDTYSSTTRCNTELWSATLSSGQHTVTIEVTGTKNPASQAAWIWVDKVEVTSAGDIVIGSATGGGGSGGPGGGGSGGGATTRAEQTDPAAQYSGAWYTTSSGMHSGGSAVLALDAGARVEFSFNGTGAKWIAFRDAWSGIAKVYVDGVFKSEIDMYSAADSKQAVLYTTPELPSGSHVLTIEVTGRKSSSSGGAWIWVDAFDVLSGTAGGGTGGGTGGGSGGGTTTRAEENSAAVQYAGSWSTNSSTLHSGGSAVLSISTGARATFTFNGTAARWIAYRDEWSGIAKIYIDGVFQTQVDTYASPAQAKAVVYTTPTLTAGAHTLTVEVTGQKSGAAQSAWIWIDAFETTGDGGSGGTGGSTGTFVRVEGYNAAVTGAWYTNNGAFNSGGSALLSASAGSRATFTFVGTAVKWIGLRDAYSGVAKVYIDNVLKSEMDTYSASDQAQSVIYSINGLPGGTHTISIEVTGTKSAASNAAWVWVDAFEYLP